MTQNQASYSLVGRKIFFGLPAYDHKVSLKMALSLMAFAGVAKEHGIDISVGSLCGCSVVSRARNLIVQDFLETDCTDLMFIDSDINFQSEDVLRLMSWATVSGRDVVAGVPRTRDDNRVYIATLDTSDDGNVIMDNMGLVRADRVATAFMLIRREVLVKLKEDHPEWLCHDAKTGKHISSIFDFKNTPEGYMGEDFLFCDRAREKGFGVWIDPTIKLGHMGVREYMGDFGNDVFYPMLKPALSEVA